MRGLEGKTIVVAGGGHTPGRPALGAAGAERLAEEGANVVVGDVSAEGAERTVAAIAAAGGVAVAHVFDAADEASVASLVDRAVQTFGGLHGVHFNAMDMSAGTLGVDSEHDVVTLPLDVWQRTIDVGLSGLVLMARHAIPHLVAAGGGGIVATSSGAAYAGEPIRVAYAAVKSAIPAVLRHIASAYGRQGIRANAILPGPVHSADELDAMPQAALDRLSRMGRSGRFGQPSDIGNMVCFLLSDDGAWVNGQNISVCGGTMLGR